MLKYIFCKYINARKSISKNVDFMPLFYVCITERLIFLTFHKEEGLQIQKFYINFTQRKENQFIQVTFKLTIHRKRKNFT